MHSQLASFIVILSAFTPTLLAVPPPEPNSNRARVGPSDNTDNDIVNSKRSPWKVGHGPVVLSRCSVGVMAHSAQSTPSTVSGWRAAPALPTNNFSSRSCFGGAVDTMTYSLDRQSTTLAGNIKDGIGSWGTIPAGAIYNLEICTSCPPAPTTTGALLKRSPVYAPPQPTTTDPPLLNSISAATQQTPSPSPHRLRRRHHHHHRNPSDNLPLYPRGTGLGTAAGTVLQTTSRPYPPQQTGSHIGTAPSFSLATSIPAAPLVAVAAAENFVEIAKEQIESESASDSSSSSYYSNNRDGVTMGSSESSSESSSVSVQEEAVRVAEDLVQIATAGEGEGEGDKDGDGVAAGTLGAVVGLLGGGMINESDDP